MQDKTLTLYEMWEKHIVQNFGPFQATIFLAYQIADKSNMRRLEEAYPNWFVTKFPVSYL